MNGSIRNQFAVFIQYLAIPTVINLGVVFLLLKLFYRKEFHSIELVHEKDEMEDPKLAFWCRISLGIVLACILVKTLLMGFGASFDFPLTWIAVAGAAPILAFSSKRIEILKKTDWHTLIFFVSMFILMQSVWNSGIIQGFMQK